MGCGGSVDQTTSPKTKQFNTQSNSGNRQNFLPIVADFTSEAHIEQLTNSNTKKNSLDGKKRKSLQSRNYTNSCESPRKPSFIPILPEEKPIEVVDMRKLTFGIDYQSQDDENSKEIPSFLSPIGNKRFISYQSNSSLILQSPCKKKNLIDLVRNKTGGTSFGLNCETINSASYQTDAPIDSAQSFVQPKKLDLIQMMKQKKQIALAIDTKEYVICHNFLSNRQSLLQIVSELSGEIKEEPLEQSFVSNLCSNPPNMHIKASMSGFSSFDNHKDHEPDPIFEIMKVKDHMFVKENVQKRPPMHNLQVMDNSFLDQSCNQDLSFMVGQEDLNKLNFDKYSFRFETVQESYEQILTNKSFQEEPSVIESCQDANIHNHSNLLIPMATHKYSGRKTLRKAVSQIQIDPENNYLNPYSNTHNTHGYSRAISSTHLNRSVLETDKIEKSFDEQGNKKLNDYIILNTIGRGGFGKVKRILSSTTKQIYAIKIANKAKLKKKMLSRTKSAYTFLEQEVAILKKMDHLNIVKLHEVIDDPDNDKLYLIMDYIEGGAVNSKMYWKQTDRSKLDGAGEIIGTPKIRCDTLKKYLRDFLVGLNYLHNVANVIHRDIKPDNLLIDKHDNLKIADFGVALLIDQSEGVQGDTGTKAFLPPESFEGKIYNGKAMDIWSAGVCFYYLATGLLPFRAKKIDELKQLILFSEPEYPAYLEPNFIDLIEQCLTKQPSQRITLDGLIIHPWVTDCGQIQIINYDDDIHHIIISDKDMKAALSGLTMRSKVKITAKLKQKLDQSRLRLKTKGSMCIL